MHIASWIWYTTLILFGWGIAGLLQKLATVYLSAEASLVWMVTGFLVLQPFLYRSSLFLHPSSILMWGLLAGLLNALGSLSLFAALKSGGKASVVVTISALYPLVVIPLAPVLFHDSITLAQGAGIVCALSAVVLLSLPTASEGADSQHSVGPKTH